MNKKATINDVARLSGVSKRTVSRVINNSPKVGKATRKKIKKIIEDLILAIVGTFFGTDRRLIKGPRVTSFHAASA